MYPTIHPTSCRGGHRYARHDLFLRLRSTSCSASLLIDDRPHLQCTPICLWRASRPACGLQRPHDSSHATAASTAAPPHMRVSSLHYRLCQTVEKRNTSTRSHAFPESSTRLRSNSSSRARSIHSHVQSSRSQYQGRPFGPSAVQDRHCGYGMIEH